MAKSYGTPKRDGSGRGRQANTGRNPSCKTPTGKGRRK